MFDGRLLIARLSRGAAPSSDQHLPPAAPAGNKPAAPLPPKTATRSHRRLDRTDSAQTAATKTHERPQRRPPSRERGRSRPTADFGRLPAEMASGGQPPK